MIKYKVPFRLVMFVEVEVPALTPEEAKERLKRYSKRKIAECIDEGFISQWIEVENPYLIRDKQGMN